MSHDRPDTPERGSAEELGLGHGAPTLPGVSAIPAHPPTVAGAIVRPARESAWPTAIGVISIVFGALGVLWGLYGAATPWLASFFSGFTPDAPIDMFAAMRKWAWWLAGLNGACVLAAIALLIAGIGLLQHRAWAGAAIVIWAIVKIGLEVGLAIVTAAMQREQFQAIAAGSRSGMPASIADSVSIVTLVLFIGMFCAFPVFMLIWFFRRNVRETIAKWQVGVRA